MTTAIGPAGDTRHHNLPELFQDIYYHLYSNGTASRAERITSDLTLVLLAKFVAEEDAHFLDQFMEGKLDADQSLIPTLHERFPTILGADDHFSNDDNEIRYALNQLTDITLSKEPAHVLGEAFQAIIGPRLRGEKGQFFTPRSLVRAMVEIVDPKPGESVLDPACGTGGFLVEAAAHQKEQGLSTGRLSGIDKDADLYKLSAAVMNIIAPERARVENLNSLEQLSRMESEAYDVVLTNPPFGAKIGIRGESILRNYKLAHTWVEVDGRLRAGTQLLNSQDPQTLFVELAIRALKPGGRMGIVLPEGMFGNKQSEHIWAFLRQHGQITGLLDCPRTTFQPGTDTKTNVLFFRKNTEAEGLAKKAKGLEEHCQIAVALSCGHDKRGKSIRVDGTTIQDDFALIAKDYREGGRKWWQTADVSGRSYLVPRYFREEKPTSPREVELTEGAQWTTIGDLVDAGLVTLNKGHEVGSDAYGSGDIPFIRTSDLSNFEIKSDPTNSVSKEVYEKYANRQALQSGDILMSVDGRYRIGESAILHRYHLECVVQSHLRIIRSLDHEQVDPFALLFALNLPSVRLRMRDLVFVQSTLGTLGARIYELRIPMLSGEGPWTLTVNNFRATLEERARLLRILNSVAIDSQVSL